MDYKILTQHLNSDTNKNNGRVFKIKSTEVQFNFIPG